MDKRERKIVAEAYADCMRLKRAGMLTEFGLGQLRLCRMLLRK